MKFKIVILQGYCANKLYQHNLVFILQSASNKVLSSYNKLGGSELSTSTFYDHTC